MLAPICSLAIGYLLGSLPTAYLLVRWKSRVDIRGAGSGNVGTLNAAQVTGSKSLGIAVLLGDLLKGSAAVWMSSLILGDGFWIGGIAGLGAILGHNYPVWLRFKGGRGLATAAGVLLVMSWSLVVVWCLIWLITYSLSRSVHGSNILASLCTPAAAIPVFHILRPGQDGGETMNVVLLMSIISLLILIRHIDTLQGLRQEFTKSHRANQR